MQTGAAGIVRGVWVQELSRLLPKHEVQDFNLTGAIPLLSIADVVEKARKSKNVDLLSESGLEVSIREAQAKSPPSHVLGFSELSVLPDIRLLPRAVELAPVMGVERFVVSGGGLYSGGHLVPPKEGKRLIILTPVHQRVTLLKLFAKYTREYLIPALRWLDFEVLWVCAGGSEERDIIERLTDFYIELPNNLAAKKNKLFEIAKDLHADFAICIDSDDFVPPSAVKHLIRKAETNTFWSALEAFTFFSAEKKEYHYFGGYPEGHDLHGQGLGSGRVYTRKFLTSLDDNPLGSEGNKGMDIRLRKTLEALCLEPQEYLVSQIRELPVGLKTNQNIWKVGQYATSVIPANDKTVSWLPESLSEAIRTFPHNAD